MFDIHLVACLCCYSDNRIRFKSFIPQTIIVETANSVEQDEVAHNESPHLDLHYLPSCL